MKCSNSHSGGNLRAHVSDKKLNVCLDYTSRCVMCFDSSRHWTNTDHFQQRNNIKMFSSYTIWMLKTCQMTRIISSNIFEYSWEKDFIHPSWRSKSLFAGNLKSVESSTYGLSKASIRRRRHQLFIIVYAYSVFMHIPTRRFSVWVLDMESRYRHIAFSNAFI